MNAIIVTGGKQYRVSVGDVLKVEKIDAKVGAEVKLDKVLAIVKDDGSVFGRPLIDGASVSAEILAQGRDDKILVYKKRARKTYEKIQGHRQSITTLKIKNIEG